MPAWLAAGDVTVAGTSQREVVGYGPRGEWRWTHGLDDVPSRPRWPVDEDHLVVTSAAGEVVALDPATGEQLWDDVVSDRVRCSGRSPTAATVVVADVAGGLAAYDVESGTPTWDAEATGWTRWPWSATCWSCGRRTPCRPSTSTTASACGAARIDRWAPPPRSSDLGSTVAVSSRRGHRRARPADGASAGAPTARDVALGVDGHLFLLDDRRLSVVDGDGDRLRGWTLSGLRGTVVLLAPADAASWSWTARHRSWRSGP